jgi:uncharacterized protein YwgA
MQNETKRRVSTFLSIFAYSGGTVHGFKKLKSIMYILSRRYPKLIPYKFDSWFFGPYSRKLTYDIDDLCWHSWLRCFLEKPKEEIEPIHHVYDLSYSSLSIVQSNLQRLEKFLYEHDVKDLREFSSHLMALEILPPSIAMNLALLYKNDSETTGNSNINEPSVLIKADYTIQFTRKNIDKLLDWYEKHGIKCSETFPANEFRVEVEPRKVDDLVSKRYDYIRLDKSRLNEYYYSHKMIHEELKKYPLYDFIEKSVGVDKISSTMLTYLKLFEEENNLEEARKKLDETRREP